MNLKTLKIHNIASIEDATIDFAGPELAGQDLFLICGPTGSGKTTILDAICLALFNKTPRMQSSSNKEVLNAFADNKDMPNKLQDTLHLVRKNAVEASVSLTFEVDGNQYQAVWRVRRSGQYNKGKEASTFTKLSLADKLSRKPITEWYLVDSDGNTHSKGVDKEIASVIKMTFDQFCKTTMLAQGDFTKFLSSSSDDKAQILEKLVGTDLYARVGTVINETANKLKADLSLMERELAGFSFLSDEQKLEKIDEIAGLKEQIKTLAQQKENADAKIKWISESNKAIEDEAKAMAMLEKATMLLKTDDAVAEEQTVILWDATTDVRTALSNLAECKKAKAKNDATAETLTLDYIKAIAGRNYLVNRHEELSAANNPLKSFLTEQQQFREMFDNADLICEKHKAAMKNQRTITDKTVIVESCDQKLKELTEEIDKLEQQKKEAEVAINKIEDDTKHKNEQLKEAGADNISEEVRQLGDRKNAVREIEHAQKLLNEAINNYNAKKNEEQLALTELKTLAEAEKTTSAEFETANKAASESNAIYEKAYLSLDNHAQALRAKVNVGDICPVCRQEIKQLLEESELKAILQPLQEKKDSDARTAEKTATTLAEARAKHLAAQQSLKKAIDNRNDASEQMQTRSDELKVECSKLDIEFNDSFDESLDEIKQEIADKEAEISERQKKIKSIQDAIKANTDSINNIRNNSIKKLDKQLDKLHESETEIRTKREQSSGAIENAKAAITTNNQEIEKMLNPDWKPNNPDSFFDELKTAADTYTENKQKHTDNCSEISTLDSELKLIAEKKPKVDELFPHCKERETKTATEMPNVSHLWTTLLSDANSLAKTIKENGEKESTASAQIAEFAGANPDIDMAAVERLMSVRPQKISEMRNNIDRLRNKLTEAQTLHNQALQKKAEYNQSPLAEEETAESLQELSNSLGTKRDEQSVKKGRLQSELDIDDENRAKQGKKKEELEAKRAEYAEWETMNSYFGSTNGKNFRNIAQSFILNELLDKANAYLENISTRYKLFCHPGTLTIMMKDSYQGGVERATNTLSGGESFIISLSLALGLSSMQNVDFEVDTLFIDEGFGTLSPEFLDPVITALKRLNQTYGRRVGIISHVDTLKQRIPAAIEVTRQGNTASQIQIKLS